MNLFCSLFLVFIGIVGIHLEFIAVSISGLGPLDMIDGVFAFGLKTPFIFCALMILVGCICSAYILVKKIKK